jgi:hypothetical protein
MFCLRDLSGAEGHSDDILCVAYCPPHGCATGGYDNRLVLWNMNTLQPYAHVRAHGPVLAAVGLRRLGIVIASAGAEVVSASEPARGPGRGSQRRRSTTTAVPELIAVAVRNGNILARLPTGQPVNVVVTAMHVRCTVPCSPPCPPPCPVAVHPPRAIRAQTCSRGR